METDRKQELRKRTKDYALSIVRFYSALPVKQTTIEVLGKQLLRSGTSVAANYREASRARSRAEFIAKIELCTQEADETQLWLELLREGCSIDGSQIGLLWKETDELISIFVTMAKNSKQE